MRLKLILSSVKERKRKSTDLGMGQSTLRLFLMSSREPYFPYLQNLGLKMVGWDAAMTHKRMNFCMEINTAVLLCS